MDTARTCAGAAAAGPHSDPGRRDDARSRLPQARRGITRRFRRGQRHRRGVGVFGENENVRKLIFEAKAVVKRDEQKSGPFRDRFFHRVGKRAYFFTPRMASFAFFETRNFTTRLAGILISSPVAGLRPMRAFRFTRTSFPTPGIVKLFFASL